MKTSPNYNREFWNRMSGQKADPVILNAGKEGNDTYLTPSEFREKLDAALATRNAFRRLGTVVHLSSPEGKLQAVCSDGTATWVPEGHAIPESADTFTTFPIQSYKLASQTRLKESFVADMSFDIERYLCHDFAYRFGRAEEESCLLGDGSTQPLGILDDGEGAEVAVTAEASDAISYDEVARLYFSLKPEYRQNAVFLMHDTTALHLRTLKDTAGSPLWRSNDDSIFGRPVITVPSMPTMATGAKAIAFGDLSFYWLVERQPLTIRRLSELYAVQGQIAFAAHERLDGRLIRPEAVKLLQMA